MFAISDIAAEKRPEGPATLRLTVYPGPASLLLALWSHDPLGSLPLGVLCFPHRLMHADFAMRSCSHAGPPKLLCLSSASFRSQPDLGAKYSAKLAVPQRAIQVGAEVMSPASYPLMHSGHLTQPSGSGALGECAQPSAF